MAPEVSFVVESAKALISWVRCPFFSNTITASDKEGTHTKIVNCLGVHCARILALQVIFDSHTWRIDGLARQKGAIESLLPKITPFHDTHGILINKSCNTIPHCKYFTFLHEDKTERSHIF